MVSRWIDLCEHFLCQMRHLRAGHDRLRVGIWRIFLRLTHVFIFHSNWLFDSKALSATSLALLDSLSNRTFEWVGCAMLLGALLEWDTWEITVEVDVFCDLARLQDIAGADERTGGDWGGHGRASNARGAVVVATWAAIDDAWRVLLQAQMIIVDMLVSAGSEWLIVFVVDCVCEYKVGRWAHFKIQMIWFCEGIRSFNRWHDLAMKAKSD